MIVILKIIHVVVSFILLLWFATRRSMFRCVFGFGVDGVFFIAG